MFFDVYLRQKEIPNLEYNVVKDGKGLILNYKFESDVAFEMPIKVTVGDDRFNFIIPSNKMQELYISNLKLNKFKIDLDHFYINTTIK